MNNINACLVQRARQNRAFAESVAAADRIRLMHQNAWRADGWLVARNLDDSIKEELLDLGPEGIVVEKEWDDSYSIVGKTVAMTFESLYHIAGFFCGFFGSAFNVDVNEQGDGLKQVPCIRSSSRDVPKPSPVDSDSYW